MPQSVEEFRTLSVSLPEGTFREETEFYVRILEILDAPDDFAMETALKRLENWLAQRPFPQKISMLTRFEIPQIRRAFLEQENEKIKERASRIQTFFGKEGKKSCS